MTTKDPGAIDKRDRKGAATAVFFKRIPFELFRAVASTKAKLTSYFFKPPPPVIIFDAQQLFLSRPY
jgi:hypothetical protein